MDNRRTFSVEEVADLLGVGKTLVYSLIHQGAIPALRLGRRRIVIPRAAIERMLEEASRKGA